MNKGPDMSVLHTNPRRFARIAGVFYLLVFIFGIAALKTSGDTRLAANLLAAAVYYVVTVMLYQLYKPVSRAGSLVTARSRWRRGWSVKGCLRSGCWPQASIPSGGVLSRLKARRDEGRR